MNPSPVRPLTWFSPAFLSSHSCLPLQPLYCPSISSFTIPPYFTPSFESPSTHNGRLLSAASRQLPSFSSENGIIPPHGTPSFFPSHLPSSESPFTGPLNFSIASRSSSSPHPTISPIDFTSFTTDSSQQSWLPTPPPTQPLASSTINSNNNSSLQDFVLYPTPSAPQPQPPRRDSRLLAPPSTTLKPSALQPFLAQNYSRRHALSLQLQRHLQQLLASGIPISDPRVAKLARSFAHWSHSNSITHPQQPHAAAVPSPLRRPSGPPSIPTYKNHPTHLNRRTMSTPGFAGRHSPDSRLPAVDLTPWTHTPSIELDEALFALPSAGDTAGLSSAFDLGHIHLDTDVNAFSPSAPTDTVSPKDVMFDASSVPPSATFTDLSTPLLESPGAFSSGPSPMFTDLDLLGPNDWTPLFDDAAAMDAFQGLAMVASIEEPSKTGMPQPVQISKPASPVKSVSSPISATGSTKPSSVAGINRPRKELSPIAFDPSDPVAAKRARNTEAARKSRAKKLERQMSAEARIADLQKQLADRDAIIANLQAQLEAQRQFA
ncbi:hypothetical protein N7539_006133 [Penicillium diatomitis]|uniref:BZIP domain-containing protein n=1 Tax=Penicillium diatomitis TaxID=2819901 RepID=A0A9W9X2K1_9EURO|nr:uncharacterized protein N7539_006133 [Penicillium diatomitis]KAJ5482687.1 hypothetical protein N7539_006133 [Penicillium diatomitis]